jgi:cytoskeleton protein RodZ
MESRQVEAFEPLPGELLVAARRAREISREKVAESLNLDLSVIRALEDNRFEELGAPVFARGHLRKYARMLKIDPDDVLRAYDAMATEQSGATLEPAPSVAEVGSPPSRGWLKPVVLGLAVLAVVVLLWRILSNGEEFAVDGPPPSASPAVADDETGPDEAGRDEAAAEGSSVPAAAPVLPDRETSAPLPATRPETAKIDATPVPSSRDQDSIRQRPAAQEPSPPVTPDERVRVVFTFETDSWLEVRDADGRRLAYEMGRGGRSRAVSGRPPLSVSLGQFRGVAITVDGRPFAVPDTAVRGNTARFSVQAPGATAD